MINYSQVLSTLLTIGFLYYTDTLIMFPIPNTLKIQ